jgi:hypothetical protein
MWKNYFCQLLSVHSVSDSRVIEIRTVEPLEPNHDTIELEIAIAKLKVRKSPGNDQIPAGGEALWSEIHKLINSVWNKEKLSDQWKE